jgi:hypothetical protein
MTKIVAILLGCKDADIAFASEEHTLFVVNGDTAEFLALSAGNTRFKEKLEIEAYIYRIISFIERDRINGYMCPEHFSTLATDVCCSVDDILTAFGKKDFEIFKAIFIFYRIVYFVTINTCAAIIVSAVGRQALACGAHDRRIVAESLTVLF